MDERGAATTVTGLAVGAIVALGFAVLISLLPDALFLEGQWRAVAYLAGALAAPPTVWEAREARSRRRTAIAALDEVPVRAKTPA